MTSSDTNSSGMMGGGEGEACPKGCGWCGYECPHPGSRDQEHCTSCDGTGDLIRIDGEWLGYCDCPAGIALKAGESESDTFLWFAV